MRWTSRRKAAVIEQIRSGSTTLTAALIEHDLTIEELRQWVRLYDAGGIRALRSTKLQNYRLSLPVVASLRTKTSRRRRLSQISSSTKTQAPSKMTVLTNE